MTILQPIFDGLKLYRELQGRVILDYLQDPVMQGTLVRVVGKDEEQFVPLMADASVTYDIIVDDAPNAPNQKEQIWFIIQAMLPLVGKVIPPEYILRALKYSPLPASVVADFEEMAKEPNPAAEQQAQLAAAMGQAEVEKTQSEAALNQAKAQAEGAKGEVEQVKAQASIKQTKAAMVQDRAKLQSEMVKGEMDMALSRAEFMQRLEELDMKRQADAEKHAAEMEKMAGQLALVKAQQAAARASVRAGE